MKSLEITTVEDLIRLIQVCVWGFVIFVLMMVLGGIVASMLYSIILVGQPMKSMAPIDTAFTKMLNDIVLILSSSVTTIVSMFAANKGMQMMAEKIAPTLGLPPSTPTTPAAAAQPAASTMPNFNWMGAAPVQFDEEWRAPPPPTTPPNYEHPEREEIANERAAAKLESA